jgi:hypothetical protein
MAMLVLLFVLTALHKLALFIRTRGKKKTNLFNSSKHLAFKAFSEHSMKTIKINLKTSNIKGRI